MFFVLVDWLICCIEIGALKKWNGTARLFVTLRAVLRSSWFGIGDWVCVVIAAAAYAAAASIRCFHPGIELDGWYQSKAFTAFPGLFCRELWSLLVVIHGGIAKGQKLDSLLGIMLGGVGKGIQPTGELKEPKDNVHDLGFRGLGHQCEDHEDDEKELDRGSGNGNHCCVLDGSDGICSNAVCLLVGDCFWSSYQFYFMTASEYSGRSE